MKKELSTLEIGQLVREFQFLVNARFEKIYQSLKKEFVFKIHYSGGSTFLKIGNKFIFLSNEKGNVPETPSSFCTVLRKSLEGKKIRKVWQKNSERIILFETDKNILMAELFGQENIVLCDSEYNVIAASRIQKEGRIINRGEKYQFPEEKTNIFKISEAEFSEIVKSSEQEIVKTLARLIGGTYSEEICLRAGIDKNSKKISGDEIKKLYQSFVSLLGEESAPMVIFDKDVPSDAVIFDLKINEGKNKVLFSNFYESLDSYLAQAVIKEKESEAERRYNSQIEKIENIIRIQEKTISELREEAEKNQKAGELIYEKYAEISKLMKELEEARKKMSWQEIKSKVKNKKVSSIDEKNSSITVDI